MPEVRFQLLGVWNIKISRKQIISRRLPVSIRRNFYSGMITYLNFLKTIRGKELWAVPVIRLTYFSLFQRSCTNHRRKIAKDIDVTFKWQPCFQVETNYAVAFRLSFSELKLIRIFSWGEGMCGDFKLWVRWRELNCNWLCNYWLCIGNSVSLKGVLTL